MKSDTDSDKSLNSQQLKDNNFQEYYREKRKQYRIKKLERERRGLIHQIKKSMMQKYKELVINSLAWEKLDFED